MRKGWLATLAGLCWAGTASAHSFGKLYTLPIPLWLYLYGAMAALLLSFLLFGFFVSASAPSGSTASALAPGKGIALPAAFSSALRLLALLALLLCIASGLVGTSNAYHNLNMTLFWVVFVLGLAYLSALCGGLYARFNPWLTLVEWGERASGRTCRGLLPLPASWQCWPALLLYAAFIWLELFGRSTPLSLALLLMAYSALNLLGAVLVGKRDWFERCEFFGLFFALISKMAPLHYDGQSLRRQSVLAQLRQTQAPDFSVLLFVLFMLSSTAFDGLHETSIWVRGYWQHAYGLLTPWVGANIVETYGFFKPLYAVYQSLGLLLSPLLYLLIYLAALAAAKRLTGTALSVPALARQFAYSLIPIALVYNITHYFTLLVAQGPQVVRLLLDPFGRGWNLFGSGRWLTKPILLDLGLVWHLQVALILAGHIASVYLAHQQALYLFGSRRQALLSQLPMLLVMVAYTSMGLWILAQPISPVPG